MQQPLTLFSFFILFVFTIKAQTPISGVINIYAKVDSVDNCLNVVYTPSTVGFSIGDRVLLIQMKGAEVNLTNTSSFGNINSYNNAGNYEIGTIANITASAVVLENALQRTYTNGAALQLVRIPVYDDVNINATLTASDWNGNTGGILVFEADLVTLNANIDLNGVGFRGGDGANFPSSCPTGTGTSLYYSDTLSGKGGEKGEGIALLTNAYLACRGKAANGGGGGNDHNGGAGGGGNGAAGGVGGENDEPVFSCPGSPGIAALAVDNTMLADKIFIGSGGGAGHGNNTNATNGGDGGGIVIIIANQLTGNGYSIISNGESVIDLAWGDGAGGGGSGGSILLNIPTITALNIEAKGGNGGNTGADQCTGPGGGGAGGVLKHAGAAVWPGATVTVTGGLFGTNTTVTSPCFGDNNGAATGGIGVVINNLILSESPIVFNPDFANAGADEIVCLGTSTTLAGAGGASYVWSPGTFLDNPFILNPICTPLTTVTYALTVTTASGCVDADAVTISLAPTVIADAGGTLTVCSGESVTLSASGGVAYSWSPAFFLDDVTIANPICTPLFDVNYTVTVTDANGCTGTDIVAISVSSTNFLTVSDDAGVCAGGNINLLASGGDTYSWSPTTYLNDATISNPICTPLSDITYFITSINASGCVDVDTININIVPAEFVNAGSDVEVCDGDNVTLNAVGGAIFNWSPAIYLDDATISNPICTPLADITYVVTSSTLDGCIDTDTINVTMLPTDFLSVVPDVNVCAETDVTLYATGGVSYSWSPATYLDDATAATPICTPATDIVYTVTSINAAGCSDEKTVVVNTYAVAPVIAGPDTVLCFGGQIKMYVTEGVSYLWTPATYLDFTTISQPTTSPLTSISYIVYVTDVNGCIASDTVDIVVNVVPEIIASNDVTICRGDTATLSATGGIYYTWVPEPIDPCIGCESIDVAPTETTTYIVQGVDANGCYNTDQVTVTVELCNNIHDLIEHQIKIYPNPTNNFIYVELPESIINGEFILMNMLGEKIEFKSTALMENNYTIEFNNIASQQILLQINTASGIFYKTIFVE